MKRLLSMVVSLLLVGFVLAVVPGSSAAADPQILKGIATGAIKPGTLTTTDHGRQVRKSLPFVSSAAVVAARAALCDQGTIPNCDERYAGADGTGDVVVDGSAGSGGTTTGAGPAHTLGCGDRTSNGNKRANQDCTYRRQAEEEQVYNPADPTNLVGGQNDSRVGYNQCGIDFSTNNGKNYGDLLPPFRQKANDPASQPGFTGVAWGGLGE